MTSGNRIHPCSVAGCGKSFTGRTNLAIHERFVHEYSRSGFKTIMQKCDICPKIYKTKQKLIHHRTSHFEPTVPCIMCDKLFRDKRSLDMHVNVTHNEERPKKCETCGKGFKKNYTLKVHQRIHTLEKPYVCDICGDAFAQNCVLKAHKAKRHEYD